jgi:hypothetical protein
MKMFGSVLVFFAELGMLAALGWWGFVAFDGGLRWVVGPGLPLAVSVVWGLLLAPRATRPLPRPVQSVVRMFLLLGGAVALFSVGATTLGVAQAVVALVGITLAESALGGGAPGDVLAPRPPT